MTAPLTPETLVAVDYETHLITPETLTPRAVCLAVCEGGRKPRLMLREEGHEYLIALLRDETRHVVGANISYDLAVLCDARDDAMSAVFSALDAGRVHDVQVLEQLHLIGTGELGDEPDAKSGRFSLASLEQRYLARNRDGQKHAPDAWRLRYAELDGVPLAQWPEEAITYPLADAEGTYRVALCQLFGEDRHNRNVEPDAMRVTWARHLEACRGVTTDPGFVESLAQGLNEAYRGFAWGAYSLGLLKLTKPTKTQQAIDLTVDDLLALAQSSVDPVGTAEAQLAADRLTKGRAQPLRFGSRTDVLSGLVLAAYGGQPPLTPKGKPSTDHDTLAESGDELLQSYAEGKGVVKLLSTYVPLLQRGATAPIRPRARLVATMRASYSQPNLQNIPRSGSIRECFRPRSGFVWVSVDYSAQELCTLAEIQYQLFGSSALGEQINKGIDGHAFLGARLLNIAYDEFLARLKSGDKVAGKYRRLAKAPNFGLPGGMSPPTLVASARDGYEVRFCLSTDRLHRCGAEGKTMEYRGRTISPTCVVCLEEAIRITEVWHSTYPEMQPYLDIGRRLARQGKSIPSAGNGLIRLAESANAYNNHLFQNLAAQCTARALYAFTKECFLSEKSVLFGNAVPVLDIHDEIIAEVREEALTECAERQAAIQIEEMSRLTPHVRVSAEPAAMRRWFKGAELVRSKSTGSIVPWWPNGWDWAPDREVMHRDMEDAK